MGLRITKRGFERRLLIASILCGVSLACVAPVRAELPVSLDAYQGITKTLYAPSRGQGLPWWSWKSSGGASKLAVFCRLHGFSRVIVPIGSVEEDWETSFSQYELPHIDELVSLAQTLRGCGIEPVAGFYVSSDFDNFANWEHVGDVVSALHVFNVTYPTARFEGLVGLQIPTAPGETYLLMNERLEAKNGQLSAGLLVGAFVSPAWMLMDSLYGAPNAIGDALSGLQEGILCCVDPQTPSDAAWPREALSYAGAAGTAMSVSIDVSSSSSADVFDELLAAEDVTGFFDAVVQYQGALRTHPSFAELVLVDYPALFERLYGAPPAAHNEPLSSLYAGGPETEIPDWPSLDGEDVIDPETNDPGDDSGETSDTDPWMPDDEKSGSYVGDSGSSGAGLGGGPGLEPPSRDAGCGCAVISQKNPSKKVLRFFVSLF